MTPVRLFHCFRLFQKGLKQLPHCKQRYFYRLFYCFIIFRECGHLFYFRNSGGRQANPGLREAPHD